MRGGAGPGLVESSACPDAPAKEGSGNDDSQDHRSDPGAGVPDASITSARSAMACRGAPDRATVSTIGVERPIVRPTGDACPTDRRGSGPDDARFGSDARVVSPGRHRSLADGRRAFSSPFAQRSDPADNNAGRRVAASGNHTRPSKAGAGDERRRGAHHPARLAC